jgi:acyl carrier protein
MENSVTRKLRTIWQEVLELDEVSLADDFFSLGGDSIMALRVVDRARAAGVKISVRDVLECPVLGDLAARLAEAADASR